MDYKNIMMMPPIAINIYAVVLTICYFYAGGISFWLIYKLFISWGSISDCYEVKFMKIVNTNIEYISFLVFSI
jgi:hypothetical protein